MTGAARTSLGPLRARALDARRPLALLGDDRAAELHDRLAYARPASPEPRAALRAVVRTVVIDHVVRRFLGTSPTATIVELGVGLNTRFERLDNGQQRWFDLDVAAVVALRRQLLPASPRRTQLVASAESATWLKAVAAAPGPRCFVLEAVLGYLPAGGARRLLATLGRRFPGATVVLDVGPRHAVVGDELVVSAHAPRLVAGDVPRAIEGWRIGLELVETTPFLGETARATPTTLAGLEATAGVAPSLVATFRVVVAPRRPRPSSHGA